MGIFRQFPYSNFHEMNLDWLLNHMNEMVEEWNNYRANLDSDIATIKDFIDFFEGWTGEQISDSVFEWLETHPEAITMNWFVTPQMYGAVADGTTDDKTAFESAINSGKQVIIPPGNYYLSDTIFSDDSVIYKDNGTYTNKTVLTSKIISDTAPVVGAMPDMNLASLGMKGIQSATFNTRKRRLVLGTHLSYANDTPILVEIEPWNSTVLNHVESTALGHVNDMTYNSRTNKIYVVSGNEDEIIPVNADNLTITNAVYSDIGESLKEISYDEVNDIYFVRSQSGVYVLDNEFRTIKLFISEAPELNEYPYRDIQGAYYQGSTIYDSQFITLYWLWGTAGSTSYARLAQYNYADASIKRMYDIAETLSDCEPETIVNIDDELFILSYINESLAIRKVIINDTTLSATNNSIGYAVRVVSPAPGITINSISLLCNDTDAFLQFNIHFDENWTVGTSKGFTINIGGLNGILMGWSGETLLMGYVANNICTLRAFCANGVADWNALIRGYLVRM